MELRDTFCKNLKYYRFKKGYSQEKLAEAINSSANYISDIETGKYCPTLPKLELIANVLDVKAYLLLKEDYMDVKLSPRIDMHNSNTKKHNK